VTTGEAAADASDDDDDDDDGNAPRRNRARPRPVYELGDSVASCSDEARHKLEQSMFKLPMLPRSAAELDEFQFAVKNTSTSGLLLQRSQRTRPS
jgi:hypothetical protein